MGKLTLSQFAKKHWNKEEMGHFIVPNTDGDFSVVCVDIQETVYTGTEAECYRFMGEESPKEQQEQDIFLLVAQGLDPRHAMTLLLS